MQILEEREKKHEKARAERKARNLANIEWLLGFFIVLIGVIVALNSASLFHAWAIGLSLLPKALQITVIEIMLPIMGLVMLGIGVWFLMFGFDMLSLAHGHERELDKKGSLNAQKGKSKE